MTLVKRLQVKLAHALRSRPPKLCPACAYLLFEYPGIPLARDPTALHRAWSPPVESLHHHVIVSCSRSSRTYRAGSYSFPATFQNIQAVFHRCAAKPPPANNPPHRLSVHPSIVHIHRGPLKTCTSIKHADPCILPCTPSPARISHSTLFSLSGPQRAKYHVPQSQVHMRVPAN
ncbi:uncharacterized protein CC84DRAFT_875637 [Paraphaeosphaeria sporulosa]|uniref:Uncharacterized protein n=1 Tax=Paraphaeosphaeria sporulosa TaxID=1460663 RepID=A0A177C8H8_9PLEO|nr:uncharacterized protein CC84DRAFT_875637 [Paraphaeosphaeria sporulosa]OAG03943.1 hypothetical protein CC84DRAFT_875637 [Paraphaeosphaeria sporulosa]